MAMAAVEACSPCKTTLHQAGSISTDSARSWAGALAAQARRAVQAAHANDEHASADDARGHGDTCIAVGHMKVADGCPKPRAANWAEGFDLSGMNPNHQQRL
ncbi:unnamed protein product [Clonostachys byssicola]|uniref:Uncharacterized protein n=1 Tax=Clonostachys byssicola TaxID=160290 RepID=A0A9N9UVJ9_9HYPO|nr:unnamed protein product [Clonostachys byssicola]